MAGSECAGSRITLAINLQLRPGRNGASARVELRSRPGGTVALVSVRGRVERIAFRRLAQTLADLGTRGVQTLLLDCAELSDIEPRVVSSLVEALEQFASRPGRYAVCGLSPLLRERFRVAGRGTGLRCWPSASELLASPFALESPVEWAS